MVNPFKQIYIHDHIIKRTFHDDITERAFVFEDNKDSRSTTKKNACRIGKKNIPKIGHWGH